MEFKKTVCNFCNCNCGIEVIVENNKILKVKGDKENRVTKGFTCIKGQALPEIINAEDRIRTPLLKDKNGRFNEITFDEAFELVERKLVELEQDFGSEALAIHVGQTGVRKQFREYVERFSKVYGTPNFSSAGSHCNNSKTMGSVMTIGSPTTRNFEKSKCIVLWGYNPLNSNPATMLDINEGLRKNARLIVIDPRKTQLAKRADIHASVLPGTDCILALGLIHIIIKEKLYDEYFVEKWTVGFESLAAHVQKYQPKFVSERTAIPEVTIIEIARTYAENGPAIIVEGIALELQLDGFETGRAITILQSLTGNIDKEGGAIINPPFPAESLTMLEVNSEKKPVAYENFSFFSDFNNGCTQANILSKSIIDTKPYPVKAAMIIGSNPILTWPNSKEVKKAFESLDFMMVMDIFMTETAKCADLIIPAKLFPERNELWDAAPIYGKNIIGISPKIIENDNCLSEIEFFAELVERLGYRDYFPWLSDEDLIKWRLKKLDIDYETLKARPEGHIYGYYKERKYEKTGFKTLTGKVELYSEVLESIGHSPLPDFVDRSRYIKNTAEYPLILTSSARSIAYYHSRYRNIKSLNEAAQEKEPVVKLHPDTARLYGVENTDKVIIESMVDSIGLKAIITDEIKEGVLVMSHGWSQANVNLLTANDVLDKVTGFPSDCAIMVKIKKLQD